MTDNRFSNDVLTVNYNAAFTDKNAGTGKIINVDGINLTGEDAGNYQLVGDTLIASASITPASLTAFAAANDKIYDANVNAIASLGDNRLNGDTISLAYASASFSDKNVGIDKEVTVRGITVSGIDAANYSVNSTATTTATIEQADLLVTATAGDKVFDRNSRAIATLFGTPIAGDTISFAYQSATFDNPVIATGKLVTVSGIRILGVDAGNYRINTTATTRASIKRDPELVILTTVDSYEPEVSALTSGLADTVTATPLVSFEETVQVDPGVELIPQQNGVQVMSMQEPAESGGMLNKIFATVPRNQTDFSGGFKFPLPLKSMGVAKVVADQITTLDGKPLPEWLTFDADTNTFNVKANVESVLPYQLKISIRGKYWVLTIQQRD